MTLTLRHYGAVGLLEPSRIGGNGYRYYAEYDEQALEIHLELRGEGGPPAGAARHRGGCTRGCGRRSRRCPGYFAGLGQLYVGDPRYGVEGATAEFVRDAMKIYAERNLTG